MEGKGRLSRRGDKLGFFPLKAWGKELQVDQC